MMAFIRGAALIAALSLSMCQQEAFAAVGIGGWGPIGGGGGGGGGVAGVSSFNGRSGAVVPNSGDIIGALGYTPAAFVPSTATLEALSASVGEVVSKTGYTTAGDMPPAAYIYASAACTLNSGSGDGGSQIPANAGGCWNILPGQKYDPRQWGAVTGSTGTADQSAPINAWLTYLGSLGGTGQGQVTADFGGETYVVNSPIIPASNEYIQNGQLNATSAANFTDTNGVVTIKTGFNITLGKGLLIDCGGLLGLTGINGVYNTQQGNIFFDGLQVYHWQNIADTDLAAGNGIYEAGKANFNYLTVEQWKSADSQSGNAVEYNSGHAVVEEAIGDNTYNGGDYQGGLTPFYIANGNGVIRSIGVHAWTAWAASRPVLSPSIDYEIFGNHVSITDCYADSGEIDDYVTSTYPNPGLTVVGCVGLPTNAVALRAWIVLISEVPNASPNSFEISPTNVMNSGIPYVAMLTSGTGNSWSQLQGTTAQNWVNLGQNSQWDNGGLYFFETGNTSNIARFAGSSTYAGIQFADNGTTNTNGPGIGALANNLELQTNGNSDVDISGSTSTFDNNIVDTGSLSLSGLNYTGANPLQITCNAAVSSCSSTYSDDNTSLTPLPSVGSEGNSLALSGASATAGQTLTLTNTSFNVPITLNATGGETFSNSGTSHVASFTSTGTNSYIQFADAGTTNDPDLGSGGNTLVFQAGGATAGQTLTLSTSSFTVPNDLIASGGETVSNGNITKPLIVSSGGADAFTAYADTATTADPEIGSSGNNLIAEAGTGSELLTITPTNLAITGAATISTTLVSTGANTAASFVPSGTTTPSKGMYLPSTNTVAFSTNTTNAGEIDSNQHWIIGNNSLPGVASGNCGTGSNGTIATGGNDQGFQIQIGAVATTSCIITFAKAFITAPKEAQLTPANAAAASWATTGAYVSAISTTQLTITGLALAGANYYVQVQ